MIREYLLPGWLMAVQVFVTLSFIIVFVVLSLLSLTIIRLPLKPVLQYEWLLVRISYIGTAISCTYIYYDCLMNLLILIDCIRFQLFLCSWLCASLAAAPIAATG